MIYSNTSGLYWRETNYIIYGGVCEDLGIEYLS